MPVVRTSMLGKAGLTADGGYYIWLINKTGSVSVKGTLVAGGAGTLNNSFIKCAIDVPAPIGVVYDDGVADGQLCRVVIHGKAYCLLVNAATATGYVRSCSTAGGGDTGRVDGQGFWEALPTSPLATDKHFQEFGHNLETTSGAGLCLCILHYN